MDLDLMNHEGRRTLGVIVFVLGLAVIFAGWMSGRYAIPLVQEVQGAELVMQVTGVLLSLLGLVLMKMG
ncbi:MAG: hypothetical protein ABH854_05275 [Candidatus Diapherotrites archaeon]|nr:hypothetical protein [Candidatus Micrarchaeota archaeon]MBU1939266.1 hypothetical protein [Candidatus Micrarchaeota archaeon]